MKRASLFFVEPYRVEVREERLPQVGPGQLLVQSLVSAISSGTEMLLYRGLMPPDMAVDETIDSLAGTFDFPLKYGYAVVGQVVAVGRDVDAGWHGRFVFAFHPHESYFVAEPAHLLPLPDGMNPETAVFLPNMETAVSFLMDGQPMIGEQVAVFGQGVVGLLTTTLLAQMPLVSLITLDQHPLRREWSRTVGAAASFDPTEPGALAALKSALQGKRPYAGADLSYELSGNPQALAMAVEAAGYNGRILIGSWYGQKQATLNLGGRFHRSHMKLISSQVSHIAPQWNGRWTKTRRLQLAWKMLAQHNPERLITHHFPINKADQAYQLLAQSPDQAIQVVLTYP